MSERPLRFDAGQFIELRLTHTHPDERGERRWFTLSSAPGDKLLSITTKIAAKNGSSYKQALQALQPGDTATMSEAMGDFVLPRATEVPLIFVAAGIGITPYLSMLRSIAATGDHRNIRMIHGVPNEDEIIFQDVYLAAAQPVTTVVSNPSDSWGGERGRLSADIILGLEKPSEDCMLYLSGPEAMVEQLSAELLAAGVHKRQLVTDFFHGY